MADKELVAALGTAFISRKDVKAVQNERPHKYPTSKKKIPWQPILEPFKMGDFDAHFDGTRTFGHYMLGNDDTCKYFAYDLDLVNRDVVVPFDNETAYTLNPRVSWVERPDLRPELTRHLRGLADGLAMRINRILGIHVAICYSGRKGLHVYGFTGPRPANVVRELALGILQGMGCFEAFRGDSFFRHTTAYQSIELEVYPKQSSLDGKEVGNLMALPLGIHRDTGERKFFVSARAGIDQLVEMNPMRALTGDLPWD